MATKVVENFPFRDELEAIIKQPFTITLTDPAPRYYIGEGHYIIKLDKRPHNLCHSEKVAEFHLAQMPGCCGLCVSYHTYIPIEWRRKGIGTILDKAKKKLAQDMEFSAMICTDAINAGYGDDHQKIMKRGKWGKKFSFKNDRTKHMVYVYLRNIRGEK